VNYTTTGLTLAEIYVITCQDGSIARFTSHDTNITYGGNVYQAIPIRRGNVQYHSDLQVDKVEISLGLVGITIGTKVLTIPQVIRRGFLRNAHVTIYRVDYVALNSADILFDGYETEGVTFNAGVVTMVIGSLLDRLKEKFPKVVYTETCNHKLYSTYCGLSKSTYQQSGLIKAGTTTQIIYADVFLFSNKASGYWLKGEINVTSGNNSGLSKAIESHGDGYVSTMFAFPESFALSDTFLTYPGCDKTGTTCDVKFGNYDNFLGFEYIPKPEVLFQ